jgi:RNA polymerase sigma factor (sigma-70 family)
MSKSTAHFTDEEFMEGLRGGNNEVLTALYKKHYNIVLKFIVNNSGTAAAAEDIYQEAIIVLYENSKKEEFKLSCAIQTYLYSVSKRLWLKQLKKNGRQFLLKEDDLNEVMDVGADLNDHLLKEVALEKVKESLSQLGEPCATLIKDFYVSRLSMEEIADKFGYTNSDNAKNQKYKCLQRLKKYFFERTTIETE